MSIEKGRFRYSTDWKDPQFSLAGNLDDIFYFQCKAYKGGKISLCNMGFGAAKKCGRSQPRQKL